MGKNKESNRFYFLIQYQKGDIIISENINGNGYLPISLMIDTILKFVVKVKSEQGIEIGGKVALKGLRLIFLLCSRSNLDWVGNGESVSKYLNLKQSKDKVERSERFDIEFMGIGGRDDLSNKVITQFITIYKQMIRNKSI